MSLQRFAQIAVATAAALALAPAMAAPITHEDGGTFDTFRDIGSAPVSRMTVNSSQTITSFGLYTDLNRAGNLNFLIFDSVTGAILYQSGPKAFADDGFSYKFSDNFSFTFQTGTTYGLTAVSDVGAAYRVDFTANTVGAFNFLTGNQNVLGFGNPVLDRGQACCDIWTALNVADSNRVPEPGTMALVGVALVGASRLRRRTTVV